LAGGSGRDCIRCSFFLIRFIGRGLLAAGAVGAGTDLGSKSILRTPPIMLALLPVRKKDCSLSWLQQPAKPSGRFRGQPFKHPLVQPLAESFAFDGRQRTASMLRVNLDEFVGRKRIGVYPAVAIAKLNAPSEKFDVRFLLIEFVRREYGDGFGCR
jgi:hypothetical protein